jgi:hypothetical protein
MPNKIYFIYARRQVTRRALVFYPIYQSLALKIGPIGPIMVRLITRGWERRHWVGCQGEKGSAFRIQAAALFFARLRVSRGTWILYFLILL